MSTVTNCPAADTGTFAITAPVDGWEPYVTVLSVHALVTLEICKLPAVPT
ncbi:MAG: hypothetical protein KGN84_13875 [Acidobacteriota bacterium]|nr:hypothetical protein [Acidobacteriota bacterium]